MICFPNAKINLGLQIIEKRTDGFHDIESIFLPIPFYDILEIIPSEIFSFESNGIKIPGDPISNICTQAYNLIKKEHPIPPVAIQLYKNIPIGAGLGGGSSDASHVLTTLNTLFELNLSTEELLKYAEELGSDCPFFIENKPKYITKKGNIMEDIKVDLKGKWLLLVDSGIHISTKEAYSLIKPKKSKIVLKNYIQNDISRWSKGIINAFQEPEFRSYPQLQKIYQEVSANSLYTSLSGSGSSIYGIFNKPLNLDLKQHKTHWMKLK